MVYPRYDLMIGDVREAQKEMETTFNNAEEKFFHVSTPTTGCIALQYFVRLFVG